MVICFILEFKLLENICKWKLNWIQFYYTQTEPYLSVKCIIDEVQDFFCNIHVYHKNLKLLNSLFDF